MRVPGFRKTSGALGVAFIALAVGYIIAAIFYYQQQKAHLLTTKLDELHAIADLKVREISAWRDVQMGNAQLPARNPFTSRALRDWLTVPSNRQLSAELQALLKEVQTHHDYRNVLLLDAKGRVLLSQPEKIDVDPYVLDLIAQTPTADKPVLSDFHRRGPQGGIVLSAFTPIPDPDHKGRSIGFLVMEIDPARFLYPYIQLWPTPSPSAETLLVERSGNDVVYLNDLRHRKGSALSLRRPLKEAELPAVKAVTERNGTVEAPDYRGVPTLGAFHEVPGSPWVLVAKIDRWEVYAELRQTAILSGVIVLALIMGTGTTLMLYVERERTKLMRQREAALEERDLARQTLLESERQAAEKLRENRDQLEELTKLLEYPPVLASNMEDEITFWNKGMESLYGYSSDQAIGQVSHQLLKTVFPQPLEEIKSTLTSAGKWQGELHQSTRSGSEVIVASLWVIHQTSEGKDVIVKINSDITQLRRAEAAIRVGEEKLRFAADAAGIGTWHWDMATGTWSWRDWCEKLFADERRCPTTYEEAFLQLVHEEDRQSIDGAIRKALQEGTEYSAEMRVVLPSGAMRWILTRGRGFYDEQMKPLHMHGIAMDVTERKEAEQNQHDLAALVESTRGAIISFSKALDGTINTWNTGAEKTYGYSAEEAVGKNISLLVPPGYPDDTVWIMEMIRSGGHIEGHETVRMKKDGGRIHVSITVSPVRDVAGRVIGASAIGIDITARKQAEEKLRASEERFAAFMDHLPVAAWVKDRLGRYTYVNREMERVNSIPASTLVGRDDDELFPPEMARQYKNNDQRVLASDKSITATEFRPGADGTTRELFVTKFPLPGIHGTEPQVAGIAVDITELRKAEEKLRESEAQFRHLAETVPQLVWMTDADGATTYMNLRWNEYTGGGPGQYAGLGWAKFLHPDDYSGIIARWTHCVETGEPFEVEYRLRRCDGEYRSFIARGLPLRNAEGEIVRWFGGCTDIEDQKRAREAAEEAARIKADFMANMSHEIRTPINGILGIADLLLDTELAALQRRYLDMLRSSGEALLAIVNEVLDFSKLEAGAMALESIEFDLRGTIEKSVESIAVRAFQKGLEMVVVVSPEVPPVFLGDPAKLRQVILNLVGNAIKFTERGEVTVQVDGRPTKGEQWELRFSVTDTGIGIRQDKLELIFESFAQAETATSRTYGGTGLGLAISKKIVNQMGGRIWAESREGGGSTFAFELNLPKVERPGSEESLLRKDIEGLRVLVVDDNDTNCFMLQRVFTAKGLVVETASTGMEAIGKVFDAVDAAHPFIQIFIDARLGDMDGFQVAERLRERLPIDRLCTMMITPDDIAGGAAQALRLGIGAYIVKPVQTVALRQALARVSEAAGEITATGGKEAELVKADSRPCCTRVLLAEDNPVNLMVAQTMLRKSGVQVTTATNGVEAVEAFEHGVFHLILMDVQMPEMDGLEATHMIRAKGSDIPIIGLTAHAMEGDRERCLASGMNDYLPKPIDCELLLEKVVYWAQLHPVPAAEPEKLLKQMGGERSDLDRIVMTFIEHAPSQLADIKDAEAAQDAVRLQKAAHRLKGALSVVAAEVARCLAENLEKAAREENLPEAKDILAKLVAEMARVLEELSKPDVPFQK